MDLKGCDIEEHNVPKPTGNLKKETCTKALTNLFFFPLSFLHYSLQKKRKTSQKFNTKKGGQGAGGSKNIRRKCNNINYKDLTDQTVLLWILIKIKENFLEMFKLLREDWILRSLDSEAWKPHVCKHCCFFWWNIELNSAPRTLNVH